MEDTNDMKRERIIYRKELLKNLTNKLDNQYYINLHNNITNYQNTLSDNKISNIFRINVGFITDEESDNFLKKNKNDLFWYTNEHHVYAMNSYIWGGINVRSVNNELKLFDLFNKNNLDKLANFIKEIEPNKHTFYISKLKLLFGYNCTFEEQLELIKKETKWDNIWTINEIGNTSLARPLNIKHIEEIRPLYYAGVIHYNIEKKTLKHIYLNFCKKYNYDGFIKCATFTPFSDIDGIFQEEIIVTGSSLLNKTSENIDHPLYWKNMFNLKVTNFSFGRGLRPPYVNIDNKLVKFWLTNSNNKFNYKKGKNTISLLTYNVHAYKNINTNINLTKNRENINNFINKLGVDVICLQETDKSYRGIYAENGNLINSKWKMYLQVSSKKKLSNFKTLDLSVIDHKRNVIIFKYKNYKIANVHLEIGYQSYKYVKGSKYEMELNKINRENREKQITKLLEEDPDIIVGDFNFNHKSPEMKLLNNYIRSNNNKSSTPHGNRPDMCFIKKGINLKFNKVLNIKCNYSDHLPIIYELKNEKK